MNSTILILLYFIFVSVKARFYAGRIKPGQFEYPKLNGWMFIENAKDICESDLACGGFTFKGSYKTTSLPMEMYFFHIVPVVSSNQLTIKTFLERYKFLDFLRNLSNENIDSEERINKYYHWSTYEVERDFIIIPYSRISQETIHSKTKTTGYDFIFI